MLRDQIIEAMARAIQTEQKRPVSHTDFERRAERYASAALNAALDVLEANGVPNYEVATKAWETLFPCQCGPEYSERNLVSPLCDHHWAEDGAREVVDAAFAVLRSGLDDKETP